MDKTTYLYITSYDLIVTGLYLVFVICLGKPVFRKLLPTRLAAQINTQSPTCQEDTTKPNRPDSTDKKETTTPAWLTLPLALAVAVLSYLLSTLFPESLSTPMLILLLTTFSIGSTFIPHYRELFAQMGKKGFLRVRVDGEVKELTYNMQVDRYRTHDIELGRLLWV